MSVEVSVTYRREWQDGYGARGWKLDVSLDDPEVIASTAEAGLRLPTSVLIQDILDHHLSGLALGGHRNEAVALHQLGLRTGADRADAGHRTRRGRGSAGSIPGKWTRSWPPRPARTGIARSAGAY